MNFLYVSNDVDMRLRVVTEVSAIMAMAKAQRQVIDYKVICDQTNNTPEGIRSGQMAVDIYIRPMWSVNMQIWNFKINPYMDSSIALLGLDFSEVPYEDLRSRLLEKCVVEI
jgi:hypothetical protein